jgi:hypothetical protein
LRDALVAVARKKPQWGYQMLHQVLDKPSAVTQNRRFVVTSKPAIK